LGSRIQHHHDELMRRITSQQLVADAEYLFETKEQFAHKYFSCGKKALTILLESNEQIKKKGTVPLNKVNLL